MKLGEVKLNLQAIDGGVWVEDPADDAGFAVRVRGRRSKDYQKAQGTALTNARKASRKKDIPVSAIQKIDSDLVAKHCLLEWRNLFGDDGEQVPYSFDLAHKLMTEREYQPFADFVKSAVDRVDENDLDDLEEIKGNSNPSSSI